MKNVLIIFITIIVAVLLYIFIDNTMTRSYEVYNSSYIPFYTNCKNGKVKIAHKRGNEQALHFDNGVTLYKVFVINNGRTLLGKLTHQKGFFRDEFSSEEAFYLILCPHKRHIVGMLDYESAVSSGYPEYTSFDLVKLRKYKNVTTFDFISEIDKECLYPQTIWLDLENDRYCGGIDWFSPMPLDISEPTRKDKEFYAYVKDMLIDTSNNFIGDWTESLDNYDNYMTSYRFSGLKKAVLQYISTNDKELGKELLTKYAELENRNNEYYEKEQFGNQSRLMRCSSPIWQIADPYKDKDHSHLPLQGGLPKNEAELKIYLSWIKPRKFNQEDVYGQPVKFEIEKEGLRVKSSGFDKKCGTADDQTYLSKYSEIDELLSINAPLSGRL